MNGQGGYVGAVGPVAEKCPESGLFGANFGPNEVLKKFGSFNLLGFVNFDSWHSKCSSDY